MSLDLEEIKRRWLNQCGPCDYGMPEYGCTHPQDDYRPVILSLVLEVERLQAESEPPNDIEATGECCCNGCIGEGPCDLELGGRRDDYPSADEYGWQDDADDYSGDLAYEGSW